MGRISLLLATWLLLLPSAALSQTGPKGWRTRQHGAEIVSVPPDLEAGQVFVLGLQPGIDLRGQDLRAWFGRAIDAAAAKLGRKVKDRGIETRGNGLGAMRAYRSKDGTLVVGSFSIAPQPDGRYLMASVFCSQDACRVHMGAVTKWIEDMTAAAAGSVRTEEVEEADTERPVPARPKRPAYRTEPGRGIAASAIEKVVMDPSGQNSSPVLLLANGEYCARVDLPPSEMDAAAHRREFPRAWGRWRRRGGKIERLRSDGGTWVATDWGGTLTRARPRDELEGAYHSGRGSAVGGGATYIILSSDITFLPGKRFRQRRVNAISYGTGMPNDEQAGTTSRSQNDGSYRFDGDAIELHHADGTVERRAFFWGDETKRMFFLNQAFYYR